MGSDEEKKPPGTTHLRRRAEDRLRDQAPAAQSGKPFDPLQLLHELQVHQVELEMQNAELRQARNEVEALLEQYTDLYDFAPVGYFTLDRAAAIQSVNLTGARLLGIERSRLKGCRFDLFIAPEDRPVFAAFFEAVFSRQGQQRCEVVLGPEGRPRLFVQIEATAAASGRECRLALIDMTELQQARQTLVKTERLDSLGVLAGGIAHDFNNLLTAILGNLSLLQVQNQDPEQTSLRLQAVEKAAVRAKDLSMQLFTFARGGEPIKQVVAVNNLLRDAAGFAALGSPVRCDFDLGADLWPVNADAGQLAQVLQNLAVNAVQAMPTGGTLTITARNLEPLPGEQRFLQISIKDSGVGIPREILQRIFDPYFTTKEQGTGLGLAICHSIIKKHGGDIMVESAPGLGTTFQIRLPAENAAAATAAARPQDVCPGRGRILIMDDQLAIREVATAILEELGFQAECTENGRDAVDLYQKGLEEDRPFAAVIMDLTVPGAMGGKEALALLRRIDPQVKAIVSSGYAADPVMAEYREYGFSAVLCKPYRLADLGRVLRDLLDPES
jgi:PAS domain S-box-containing protein